MMTANSLRTLPHHSLEVFHVARQMLVAIRDAAVAVLARDGTLLWGNTSGQTAVNIAPLDHQDYPVRVSVWRDRIASIFLRAVAGALLGLMVITFRGRKGEEAHAHE
jgi:hypothetical protein